MRHGAQRNRNRSRGHNNTPNNGNRRGTYNRNQIFDSNGPDVRIRGTAHQVCEKYLALAKDAQAVGDIVQAESYLQHAEHYQRIINTWTEEAREQGRFEPEQAENGPRQQDEDLGLPSSILGGEVKVESKQNQNSMQAQDQQPAYEDA